MPLWDNTMVGATRFYITAHPGEKALNAPLTVAGYTTVGTNTPSVPVAASSR